MVSEAALLSMSNGGRVGGNRTKEKYGPTYFSIIGKRGGRPKLKPFSPVPQFTEPQIGDSACLAKMQDLIKRKYKSLGGNGNGNGSK